MDLKITDNLLDNGEFYEDIVSKNTFYIHHTAGSHNPINTIYGWETDKTSKGNVLRVATSFIIGGLSTSFSKGKYDDQFDGVIYRTFDEKKWAHHLGTKFPHNVMLNQQSVAVELCNYGPITLGKDGKFYNYVNREVPKEMVIKLDKPFRGYAYYHAYTDKQIEALKNLIVYSREKFPNIPLNTPLLTVNGFEVNADATAGKPGIYGHSNVRKDKFDMSPQPKLIEMLKSLVSPKTSSPSENKILLPNPPEKPNPGFYGIRGFDGNNDFSNLA